MCSFYSGTHLSVFMIGNLNWKTKNFFCKKEKIPGIPVDDVTEVA